MLILINLDEEREIAHVHTLSFPSVFTLEIFQKAFIHALVGFNEKNNISLVCGQKLKTSFFSLMSFSF